MSILDAPSEDYVIRVIADPAEVPASEWNALLASSPVPTPFLRHEFLGALHQSGSAVADTGWAPLWLLCERGGQLRAGCAMYLKSHSYGEYVFDWAWADAHQRHGLPYYPKLLGAVPFTPVPGSRLLAHDDAARRALLDGIGQLARQQQLSSAHLLFLDAADEAAARDAGWLIREGVQFHWSQPEGGAYADFAGFLATLHRDKRKKIQQERRRVADAGLRFTVHEGEAIDAELWRFFHRCYTLTYRAHGSTPYLRAAFFEQMRREMPWAWVMFVARRGDEPLAASLVAVDETRTVAWGRYWGAVESVPCLHFEACYYQPLAWCIEHGVRRFEGGAQGEHKMARGLLPVRTTSAHWLAHPAFERAVADFLAREGAGVSAYVDELREHSPFKSTPPAPAGDAEAVSGP